MSLPFVFCTSLCSSPTHLSITSTIAATSLIDLHARWLHHDQTNHHPPPPLSSDNGPPLPYPAAPCRASARTASSMLLHPAHSPPPLPSASAGTGPAPA
jgi:hypothetical protein